MKSKSHTLSDSEVLAQSLQKPWLFGILVNRYQKVLMRKGVRLLGSTESAEDAVQETFLKIYKNAHQFSEQPGASFKSWAYKILVNTCYNELVRREKNKLVQAYDFADLDVMASVQVADDTDNRSYVASVMSRMPQSLSRFLYLYFFEDKSQKEIAQQEHMSETAVRSRIHRAKKSFKHIAQSLAVAKNAVFKTISL